MKLLLADDEVMFTEALKTILTKNQYSVDVVHNGSDALFYLENENYDLAILDIMMPEMDGVEVLKAARAQGLKLPIIMLTAKSEVNDRILGLDAGADDYLPKPFNSSELLARLRALLRRKPDLHGNELKYGDLSLNLLTYDIKGPKGSDKMSNKEFQMLEILLRNPGQTIATERFMEQIWGYDSDSEINVVWVYVSNLRKKLKAIGSSVEIKAARGVGYYLENEDA